MPTRRSLLEGIGAALGVAGVGATAGCLGSLEAGDGGSAPSGPAYASRLYDPSSVMESPVHGFATYDLATLYEHRDLYPERVVEQVERYDDSFDAVSISELGRATAQGYTTSSVEDLSESSGEVTVGMSAFVEGSFQPEAMVDLLTTQMASGDGELVEDGSVAGHDLYTVENLPSENPPSMTLGMSADSVGMGVTFGADATGTDALRPMLEAGGDGSGYYRASSTGRAILDAFEDPTTATGMVADVGTFLESETESMPDDEHVRSLVGGLQGLGSGGTLDGESITTTMVGVYAEGETPSQDDLDGVIAWIEEQTADAPAEVQIPLDDIETSVEGRTVTASLTRSADRLFDEDGRPAMGAAGMFMFPFSGAISATYLLGYGSASPNGLESAGDGDDDPTPSVAFDFEWNSDSRRVRIRVAGGEVLDEDNTGAVRYGVGGEELSEWPLPVQAGDQTRVEDVGPGDTVIVLWEGPDGDRTELLSEFEVPS